MTWMRYHRDVIPKSMDTPLEKELDWMFKKSKKVKKDD